MRILLFLGLIILIAAAWAAGWFYAAGQVEQGIALVKQRLAAREQILFCENEQTVGFPFRIGIACDELTYRSGVTGLELSANASRSATQFYDPTKAIIELSSPGNVKTPSGVNIATKWQSLRASVKADFSGPERFSVHGKELELHAVNKREPARVEEFQLHGRKSNEDDADLALSLTNYRNPPSLSKLFPDFDLEADISLVNAYNDLLDQTNLVRLARAKGLNGAVRHLSYRLRKGGEIIVSGPIEVHPSGLISGKFNISTSNPDAIAQTATNAYPAARSIITQVLRGLKLMAGGSEDGSIDITITVRQGKASIGFIPVGEIPPIF